MNRKKKSDDRKQLLIRYNIDEKGRISFIDPCCDEIPVSFLGRLWKLYPKLSTNGTFVEIINLPSKA